MYLKQRCDTSRGEVAYYIESEGAAAVIDPQKETAQYLQLASERSATIKYVLLTHYDKERAAASAQLADKAGATLVYWPNATATHNSSKDGERLRLGNVQIETVHTPGHTLASTCYLLYDEAGKKQSVFTGDTLYINGVCMPESNNALERAKLASLLFDSLQQKIKTLPDHVAVCPAYASGSPLAKNAGKKLLSTIGEQKANNPALAATDKEAFVHAVAAVGTMTEH